MRKISVYEFGGPEVLKFEETGDSFQPKSDEVVIRIKAVGINPYETYMRAGSYGARNPALPFTPGSDAAGIVESVGAGVSYVAAGDRVYTAGTISGAYAEFALCNRSQVHHLPPQISFAQGAALFVPYATAYRSLFQLARIKPEETILIHGASGGVGIAAIQLARAAGAKIIGTAGTKRGLELIEAEGAHFVVNHNSPDYQEEILELTNGRGVDIILEMLANKNLGEDLKMLAQRGRVVIIGSRGTVEINPRDAMLREATITGMYLWGTKDDEFSEIFAGINAGLEEGTLSPTIGLDLPLSEAAKAHRQVMQPGTLGKIILVP